MIAGVKRERATRKDSTLTSNPHTIPHQGGLSSPPHNPSDNMGLHISLCFAHGFFSFLGKRVLRRMKSLGEAKNLAQRGGEKKRI